MFAGNFYLKNVKRNLPEVRSAHEILQAPTVSARFGSEPFFWNWGMQAFARILRKVSEDFKGIKY